MVLSPADFKSFQNLSRLYDGRAGRAPEKPCKTGSDTNIMHTNPAVITRRDKDCYSLGAGSCGSPFYSDFAQSGIGATKASSAWRAPGRSCSG